MRVVLGHRQIGQVKHLANYKITSGGERLRIYRKNYFSYGHPPIIDIRWPGGDYRKPKACSVSDSAFFLDVMPQHLLAVFGLFLRKEAENGSSVVLQNVAALACWKPTFYNLVA
ncbi:hypothetical protein TH61_12675 [Rufibacter sp. DG15C]|nr:hypothetical protein TH61_12675 [Rufibacter sp. DG15C]